MDRPLGLYTDLYELRMVASYLRRGMTAPATFSLYIRPTPQRPWFVAFGVQRALEFVQAFAYSADELDYLRRIGFDDETLRWLEGFEASGEIFAAAEGTVVLGDEPILEVTAPLPVAQLLETGIINVVHHATLIATKAARVAIAAAGRPVVEFGFRRAHGLQTGVDAAVAAYVGGGLSTSNVEAGRRHGLPVVGTMAHSFIQAYDSEIAAFRAFAQDNPEGTILLVDTYDTREGVANAITVALEMRERGHELRAVRLDSGDLASVARDARRALDEAGFPDVQIFASGGLDETDIAAFVEAGVPIDAYGVGTDLVVSADRPALDMAYKLVSYDGRDVAKHSEGKRSLPGAKQIFRTNGPASDVLALRDEAMTGTRLLVPAWRDGKALIDGDIESARARASRELESLPDDWKRIGAAFDPPSARLSDALRDLARG